MVTDGNYTYNVEHVRMYIIVKLPCCIPETTIVLFVNCTSINKGKKKEKTLKQYRRTKH